MTLDREWFVVSHVAGRSVRLSAFETKSREPTGFYIDPSLMSGSHVVAHDLAA